MQYTVKAAARATGVGESTLRTWERRYGVPSPGRSATGRRLYEEEDLRVIRRMAALVAAGLPAAQAADAARAEGPGEAFPSAPAQPPPPAHPAVAQIVSAAQQFDDTMVGAIIGGAIAELGWSEALEAVVFPALHAAGEEWERGALNPAHEHFLSELLRSRIAAASVDFVASRAERSPPLALLACPEDERHELGLAAFALLLRERGLHVTYLGADVGPAHLLVAAEQLRPAAIVLAATTPAAVPALAIAARAVIGARLPSALFVGGPAIGGANDGLSVPGVRLPHRAGEAADFVAARLGVSAPG
ncbi:MAG: MerR family transcriptional regulator [Chloroflexi bacterium]|nr:MerR family transcriptional regulator [Chloroflexota bacterium]